jgi:hypothetical protein
MGNKMTHLLADGAVLSRDEEPAGSGDMVRANDAHFGNETNAISSAAALSRNLTKCPHALDFVAGVKTERLECGQQLLLERLVARFGHHADTRLRVDGADDVI